MQFTMPTLEVLGKASELIQGADAGPLDQDGTGKTLLTLSNKLEED